MDGAPLPQRKAIDYAVQIARGLAAAHEKGVVHRDLKPDNIFVLHDGRSEDSRFWPGEIDAGRSFWFRNARFANGGPCPLQHHTLDR